MNLRRDLLLIAARAAATLCVLLVVLLVAGHEFNHWLNGDTRHGYEAADGGKCNVAIIPLQGVILTYDPLPNEYTYVTVSGDAVISAIHAAEADRSIRGILLQIDSGGGSPAASEAIMTAMKREKLPTAAYIREQGTSGAYLAATGAQTIIAGNYSDVGGIGVTESYVQQVGQDQKSGLQFVSLSSGPFKDSFNPDKPITEAERAMAQRDVDFLSQIFIGEVAQNRHLSTSTVQTLADGSSMPAATALLHGLIDQVGDDETARAWFDGKIGGGSAVLCVANL